jgi:hypothetical protein
MARCGSCVWNVGRVLPEQEDYRENPATSRTIGRRCRSQQDQLVVISDGECEQLVVCSAKGRPEMAVARAPVDRVSGNCRSGNDRTTSNKRPEDFARRRVQSKHCWSCGIEIHRRCKNDPIRNTCWSEPHATGADTRNRRRTAPRNACLPQELARSWIKGRPGATIDLGSGRLQPIGYAVQIGDRHVRCACRRMLCPIRFRPATIPDRPGSSK